MKLEDVDPRDDDAFADWFAVVDAVTRDLRPDETGWLAQELRESSLEGQPRTPPPDELYELLVARHDGGRVVGAARLELPLSDNQHVGFFSLDVLPDARRSGVGTALLAELTTRTRAVGRTTLMCDHDEPPALADRSPGRFFLQRNGFAEALVEARRDLALPVDPERLDAIDAACWPHASDYRVLTWRDHCPPELVDDRAELARAMSVDVPLGELAWGEEVWDAARLRRREELTVRQGRASVVGGAVHVPSGSLVAFTEMVAPLAAPDRVHQWETMVLDAHRGHRLGTLVKTAALRRLAAEVPQARLVSTTNALSNGPMIAVNEALGFRLNGVVTSWQRAA